MIRHRDENGWVVIWGEEALAAALASRAWEASGLADGAGHRSCISGQGRRVDGGECKSTFGCGCLLRFRGSLLHRFRSFLDSGLLRLGRLEALPGPIDIADVGPDWLISGGESGQLETSAMPLNSNNRPIMCLCGRLNPGRTAVLFPRISLAVLAAVLLSDIQAASAQSPYTYPWCSVRGEGGGRSCYYTSWEQCRATQSGLGGLCVPNPYYRTGR